MLQFPQGFGFDLPDPFPGDRELLANLLEGMIRVHPDAKPHAEHALLPGS